MEATIQESGGIVGKPSTVLSKYFIDWQWDVSFASQITTVVHRCPEITPTKPSKFNKTQFLVVKAQRT